MNTLTIHTDIDIESQHIPVVAKQPLWRRSSSSSGTEELAAKNDATIEELQRQHHQLKADASQSEAKIEELRRSNADLERLLSTKEDEYRSSFAELKHQLTAKEKDYQKSLAANKSEYQRQLQIKDEEYQRVIEEMSSWNLCLKPIQTSRDALNITQARLLQEYCNGDANRLVEMQKSINEAQYRFGIAYTIVAIFLPLLIMISYIGLEWSLLILYTVASGWLLKIFRDKYEDILWTGLTIQTKQGKLHEQNFSAGLSRSLEGRCAIELGGVIAICMVNFVAFCLLFWFVFQLVE